MPGAGDCKKPTNLNDADYHPKATQYYVNRDGPTKMAICRLIYIMGDCLKERQDLESSVIKNEMETAGYQTPQVRAMSPIPVQHSIGKPQSLDPAAKLFTLAVNAVKQDIFDEAWVQVSEVYYYHEDLFDESKKSNRDLAATVVAAWETRRQDLSTRLGYLPDPEDARWFTALKNHYWGHVWNHFDGENGCIYIDVFPHDIDDLRAFPSKHPELENGTPGQPPVGKFVRFKIDPKAESTELEPSAIISDMAGGMARCDGRYTTKPYNHAYGGGVSGPRGFGAILHINIGEGVTNVWHAGEDITVGEPCFVPCTPDAPEGDGHLVVSCRNHKTTLGFLLILDSQNITAGPVGVIELPLRLRDGVHGNWVPVSEFASRKPLVDYAGVTPEIQEKFGTGAPKPYDDLSARPVKRRP
ncbi:uncharacterized protein FTOL_12817 [Fusarium torulosum]|uniref:Uncharacterized protein n=1 Tax=Fusarium torulosum TaxID=33205 RepID=A0AAE8MKI9_9HYPO|nr:uncharacterized protein FTOL_12817 [Fusarium torulosum]